MVHLVCANMPRAGHHLLERMLRLALGTRYRYCEYHQALECCRRIPCEKHGQFASAPDTLFMQKNHDFRMDTPRAPGEHIRYLVQFRHPLPRLFSFFDLRVRAGAVGETPEDLELFMAKEAAYQVLFVEKWISRPRQGDILVKYEDLVSDTGAVLAAIFAGLGVGVESAVIETTVKECLSYRDLRGTRHKDRDVSTHALYDPPRLEAYERFIFSRTGEELYSPAIPPAHHDPGYFSIFSNLVESHIHEIRQDREAAREYAGRIPEARRSPAIRRFMDRLARGEEMSLQQRQVRQRIAQILADGRRSKPERSAELYALGRELLQGSQPSLAAQAILEASDLCPEDGELHHQAARICVRLGRYAQAISHCKAAVRACPDKGEYCFHGATVMEHHGQIPDALDFSLRALELEPGNGEYRQLLARIDEQARQSIDAERYGGFRERVQSLLGGAG